MIKDHLELTRSRLNSFDWDGYYQSLTDDTPSYDLLKFKQLVQDVLFVRMFNPCQEIGSRIGYIMEAVSNINEEPLTIAQLKNCIYVLYLIHSHSAGSPTVMHMYS
jgi:hypothetical protein